MPRWDFDLTVVNSTDRKLKLITISLPWGDKGSAPDEIPARGSGKYNIYAKAGVGHGYEFSLVFRDEVPADKESYGTVTVNVDVPLSKSNKSSLQKTGILNTSGWDGTLPKSGHDFARTLEISKQNL